MMRMRSVHNSKDRAVLLKHTLGQDVFGWKNHESFGGIDENFVNSCCYDGIDFLFGVVLDAWECDAEAAVVQGADLHGNIIPTGKAICPAVATVRKNNPSATEKALVNEAIKANVWQAIEDLFRTTPTIVGRAKIPTPIIVTEEDQQTLESWILGTRT